MKNTTNIYIKTIVNSFSSLLDVGHAFSILSITAILILFIIGATLKRRKAKINEMKYHVYRYMYYCSVILVLLSIIYISMMLYLPKYVKYPHVNKLLFLALTLIIGVIVYHIFVLVIIDLRKVLNKTLNRELDDIVIKWISIAIKVIISIIIFFIILRIYNINITTLIAGLGIGGIAVALAAQDTISNILGCAIIVLDKPFMIGSRIKLLEYDGMVEAIGLRSVRIRTFDGSLIVVPNKTISNSNIENISSRTSVRQSEEIDIEPYLNSEEVKDLILSIKNILEIHSKINNDYGVYFDRRNGTSITIRLTYYTNIVDYVEYMNIKEDINYSIYDIMVSKNIKYSIPSSNVYINNK